MSSQYIVHLACPICKKPLVANVGSMVCQDCNILYPLVGNVPVLINECNSIFSIADYLKDDTVTTRPNVKAKSSVFLALRLFVSKFVPCLTLNLKADKNYSSLIRLLSDKQNCSFVLVVGGGSLGLGMENISKNSSIQLVSGDVYFGPYNSLILDAHDLPFVDATFDAVIIQAVLEHVVDPFRCVSEIRRVLKPGGFVYAETPFLQQVHGGKYDFSRFTLSGHRRLFRYFDEIESGCICGPGSVLACTISSFFDSFSRAKLMRVFRHYILPFFIFWMKYLDYYFIRKKYVSDNASATYFLGSLRDKPLSDKEILNKYYDGC